MSDLQATYPWAKFYRLQGPLKIDSLGQIIDEIWAQHSHNRRQRSLETPVGRLVGISPGIEELRNLIGKVAPSQATVLIRGESGSGKEVVARAIHEASGRTGEFIAVNCGAIPDTLFESELFGHERGAFTDAVSRKLGQLELANGGTIFLDEIGDMPASMQVKLLRVLQERVIERVGGAEQIPIDLRVLAATHQDLGEMMNAGTFREDLFYRLNVFPLDIAPLRDRPEDVPVLTQELVRRLRVDQRTSVEFSDRAMAAMQAYNWPGNVRELANLIERLSVVKPHGRIAAADLPVAIRGRDIEAANDAVDLGSSSLKQHLAEIEIGLIRNALDQSDGVVSRAAELLKVGRTTLVEKIRRYQIH